MPEDFLVLIGHDPRFDATIGQQLDGQRVADSFRVNRVPPEQLKPTFAPLPPDYAALKQQLLEEPAFRNSHPPAADLDVGLVDLDRVIVYQMSVNLTYARSLTPPGLTLSEALLRYCFPPEATGTIECRIHEDERKIVVVSDSDELRVLGSMLANGVSIETDDQNAGRPPHGRPIGFPSYSIGFAVNYLQVWQLPDRQILMNGTHRAYTLYEQGIRQVPCIVQRVAARANVDELMLANKEVCFGPRPPMFRDYFNPELFRRTTLPKHRKAIIVTAKQMLVDEDGEVFDPSETLPAAPPHPPREKTPKARAAERKRFKKKWGL